MKTIGIGRWISRRFVFLCEACGYAISLAVGAFLVYAAFQQVDVSLDMSGSIGVYTVPVTTDNAGLIVGYAVPTGGTLKAGDPLCTIVTEPTVCRDELCRRHLQEVVRLLERTPDATTATAHAKAREALDAIGPEPPGLTILSPVTGSVVPLPEADQATVRAAGTPLAHVYSSDRLRFDGTLGDAAKAGQVRKGDAVHVRLSSPSEELTGQVESVAIKEGTASVVACFDNVAPTVCGRFLLQPGSDTPGKTPGVKARVVVGRRSLFRHIFGRR